MRAQIANMVAGVTTGFSKTLEIVGTGYRAQMDGQEARAPARLLAPGGVPSPGRHHDQGRDPDAPDRSAARTSASVGQVAANIRGYRPPEPYKGKGIKYEGEYIRRKAGKAAGSA